MSISVIILAAGQGTRMKSDTPKVLHTVSGKAMLFHVIDAGVAISDDITVVLYHQAKRVQEEIEREYSGIKFHIQDVENFAGTGGALRGIEYKYTKSIILNGDMPLITKKSLTTLINGDGDINLSVIRVQNPTGYGRVVIKNGDIKEIVEEKDCSTTQKEINIVNGGVYVVESKLLDRYIPKINNNNAQKEYYLTDIIKMAVEENRVVKPIYVLEEEFKGVNSKLDLAIAEEIMQKRIKEKLMKNGTLMRLPDTIYIDSRASFEGESIIENGVSILGKTHIKDSYIKTNSVIESSTIENSSIGPMGRVRPNSYIKDTHIVNFVEVKKSTLNGVKAGHLSYLGDSTIDKGTNIGAGVITCNYDGKAKYKTIIGKNVFVGSDCQLIAPISIEDDVIIGAGTTLTKDVKKGSLAISRTPLKIISDYFYKFFGKSNR
jgi:bifunctional UDP-N-acetylglucosamine pyrophosphorylase/glucosamine-1-phosphate N-acetyltransferase